MAIVSTYLNGTNAVDGNTLTALNLIDTVNAAAQISVPIGSILSWAKTLTGVPALNNKFVECNGQTLVDAESPLNGQVIPNLNGSGGGTKRFLRGSTTSGATGGSDTNSHTHTVTVGNGASSPNNGWPNLGSRALPTATTDGPSDTNNMPSYYEVVWIMRVK